jgi:hypothetical protein
MDDDEIALFREEPNWILSNIDLQGVRQLSPVPEAVCEPRSPR